MSTVHRPGHFKQANKKHKGGSGSRKVEGRVEDPNVFKAIKNQKKYDSRDTRKNQSKQIQKNKRDAVLQEKRFGITLPKIIGVVPLTSSKNFGFDECWKLISDYCGGFEKNQNPVTVKYDFFFFLNK